MPPAVPVTVLDGRYELLERLGRGGMAEVIRGWDHRLRRDVAIKFLAPRYSQDPGVVDRFRQEIAALAQLDHPNVVTIFDTGETDDGRLYLVMERLQGQTLDQMLRGQRERGEVMGWSRLAAIARQLCGALQSAHTRQIVHRDIKPSNIFRLSVDGNRDFVKLLDFGIAKVVAGALGEEDEDEGRAPLTAMGAFVGTPHYAAPELIAPERHGAPDLRADLFSLGVVLYECATGVLPFEGIPKVAVLSRTALEPLPPPSERAPERMIPRALEMIIVRATALSPGDRFASARELGAALSMFEASVSHLPHGLMKSGAPIGDSALRAGPDGRSGDGDVAHDAPLNRSAGPLRGGTGASDRSWSVPNGFSGSGSGTSARQEPRVTMSKPSRLSPGADVSLRAPGREIPPLLPQVRPPPPPSPSPPPSTDGIVEVQEAEDRTTHQRARGAAELSLPPGGVLAGELVVQVDAVVHDATTDAPETGAVESTAPSTPGDVASEPIGGMGLWGTAVAVVLALLVVGTWVWMPPPASTERAPTEIVPFSPTTHAPTPIMRVTSASNEASAPGINAVVSTGIESSAPSPPARIDLGSKEGDDDDDESIYADVVAPESDPVKVRACRIELKRVLEGQDGEVKGCLDASGVLLLRSEIEVRVRATSTGDSGIQATVSSDDAPKACTCISEHIGALTLKCRERGVVRSHSYIFPACGDGKCSRGESCQTCSRDCPCPSGK